MKLFNRKPIYCGIIIAAGVSPVAPQAVAATNSAIEEIVITARMREESLLDAPDSVTVMTETVIQDAGIERPEDFVMLTPGVTMTNTAEIGDTQVNIRGINTARDAETNFAYVVDGVLMTNPNAFNRELADIQQIEILKGPQGALYGRNAVAGAIIVNTKKPSSEVEGKVSVGIGNNDTQVFKGVISGPIIGEKLLGRLSFASRDTDGHFKNDFLDRDDVVDNYEEQSLHGRLIWEPNDQLSVDTRFGYSEAEGAAIGFNASVHLVDAGAFFPDFYQDVNDHDYQYLTNIRPENEQDNVNFSIKVDYEMDWATLTGVVSYNDQENFFMTDGTSAAFQLYSTKQHCLDSYAARAQDTPFNPPFNYGDGVNPFTGFLPPYSPTTCDGYQYQERNQEDISFELRLTSPGDQPLRWIAGIYYGDVEREVVVAQGEQVGSIIKRPYNDPSTTSPTDLLYHDVFESKIYAVFGQIAYDLTEDLEVAFALRYDREEREVSNKVPLVSAASLDADFDGIPDPINPALRFSPSIDDRDEDFTQAQPKLTLNWKVAENVSVYTSYGVGFRSGGFNSQGTSATIETFYRGLIDPFGGGAFDLQVFNVRDDFEKEVSRAVELGMKSNWLDGRLSVNAAAYHTQVDDMQYFEFYVGSFGLLRTVTNIDEVTIQGFELDVNMQVNDYWSVYAAGSWIDGEIDKNANRPYTEGNDVPYTADVTYNLGSTLTLDLSQNWQMVARLDWAYIGDTWFHTVQDNTLPNLFTVFGFGRGEFSVTERDAYDLLNLRIALRSESWTVAAWGKNITGEEYANEVITAPEFGGSFVHDSPRESYGIDVEFRF